MLLERVVGTVGRLVSPDRVDQCVGRHHLVRADGKCCEYGALLRPGDRDRDPVDLHVERAEDRHHDAAHGRTS